MDDLLREVAHKGMRIMNEQMTQAAIGTLGDAAIKSICIAYFKFGKAITNPEETITGFLEAIDTVLLGIHQKYN